jgi:hypothetical protein
MYAAHSYKIRDRGRASAEAEWVEAITGKIVAAVIDYQRGRKYDKIT